MPDSPLLANGGDPWQLLTLLVSLGAILTSAVTLVRMVLSQGKFTGTVEQKLNSIQKEQTDMEADILRDRRDHWQAIKELQDDNKDCNRERGELRAAIDTWRASVNSKIEPKDSPAKRSHPRDAT